MFKDILGLFNSNSVHRIALVSSIASNVMKTFEQEFKDGESEKAIALEALIALLQELKASSVKAPTA